MIVPPNNPINKRFRGFLPVVVDVETGGFNPETDALLEVALVILTVDENQQWQREATHFCHLEPFAGSVLEPAALKFTGIDPYHPFRLAKPEKEGLQELFTPIRKAIKKHHCNRAVLVGHNAAFDLNFINAAIKRNHIKRNPFHQFSCFDTATLAGLAIGQTVLSKALQAIGESWDNDEAHSALYDAEKTADLFCYIVNQWQQLNYTKT